MGLRCESKAAGQSHMRKESQGDLLKARLAWEIREKHHQLNQKNTIIKVLEKVERPKQMRFDGRKDEDLLLQQPKGRKFRDE